MGILLQLLQPLIDRAKQALAPLNKLFEFITRFWTAVTTSFGKGRQLATLIILEIEEWKNFKEAVPFRTGVLSIPSAIENTRELIDQVIAAWHSVVDLGTQLKEQLSSAEGGDPAADAKAAIDDIEASGFRDFLTKFPKLAQGLEKILGFAAIVLQALESIISAIDDLTNIVNALKAIREEVETGSTVFLSQKNPRKSLALRDGGSIKVRVGNLH